MCTKCVNGAEKRTYKKIPSIFLDSNFIGAVSPQSRTESWRCSLRRARRRALGLTTIRIARFNAVHSATVRGGGPRSGGRIGCRAARLARAASEWRGGGGARRPLARLPDRAPFSAASPLPTPPSSRLPLRARRRACPRCNGTSRCSTSRRIASSGCALPTSARPRSPRRDCLAWDYHL